MYPPAGWQGRDLRVGVASTGTPLPPRISTPLCMLEAIIRLDSIFSTRYRRLSKNNTDSYYLFLSFQLRAPAAYCHHRRRSTIDDQRTRTLRPMDDAAAAAPTGGGSGVRSGPGASSPNARVAAAAADAMRNINSPGSAFSPVQKALLAAVANVDTALNDGN